MKFGSGDLRFDTARTDEKTLRALPDAVASFFRKRGADRIYIGYDTRLTSPSLAESFSESVRNLGMDCVMCPVPVSSCLFYWSCLSMGIPGIMITASHNPGRWNGLKMVDRDLRPISPNSDNDALASFMEHPLPHEEKRGALTITDTLTSYMDFTVSLSGMGRDASARILVDFLHGVNGREIGGVLSRFPNVKADYMHVVPDGSFPAGDPNPLIESSIAPFRERLAEGHYDLGFVFDGDGDRTALFTGDGTKIESFTLLPLIGGYLSDDPHYLMDAKVPLPLMTESVGLCRTGHGNFKRMMAKEDSWTAGAEGSGHFFYRLKEKITESSMLTMLLTIRAFSERKEEFERTVKDASRFHTLPEISKEFTEPGRAMKEVRDHFEKEGAVFYEKDSDGEPLRSLIMGMDGYQIYQHASETEEGKVRWQITEYGMKAADAAFRYLECIS